MPGDDPIKDLINELGFLPDTKENAGREDLARHINGLLNTDFSKLISVLYRMDVNETKLRRLLNDNPETDAGLLIADLMIERQLQKIKTRRANENNRSNQRDNDIDENEKW